MLRLIELSEIIAETEGAIGFQDHDDGTRSGPMSQLNDYQEISWMLRSMYEPQVPVTPIFSDDSLNIVVEFKNTNPYIT